MIRQVKTIAASFDNNAFRCYDNIAPPQAMINSYRLGLPRSAAIMLTTEFNNAVYILQTGHSLSARIYKISLIRIILVAGQGSCASPSIWVSVLDPILWSIVVKYTCYNLKTPSGSEINRIGDVYVDYISLMIAPSSAATNSLIKLTAQMVQIAQKFERKLFSTGGRLNLKKCFWYLISWRWEMDSTSKMLNKTQSSVEVKLTQEYKIHEKVLIQQMECDIPCRTMGTWINLKGKRTHLDPTITTEYIIRLGHAQD